MKESFCKDEIKKLAIGVSGGADSMALALLAKHWANKNNKEILALTIDHRLRPESKSEANMVKNFMKQNSIAHKILLWKGHKPETGIQKNARIARHKLFAESAIKYKINYILLGHHKDDQIETFIMRLSKNSGLDGLCCMSPINHILTELGLIKILRPFLDINKEYLVKFCEENNINWIEDPSNKNIIYTRTKIRSITNESIKNDFYKSIKIYKRLKKSFNLCLENFIETSIHYNENGICKFSRKKFLSSPYFIQKRFLKKLFLSIGGKIYPPKSKIINGIIENIGSKNHKNATAGKVFFDIKANLITVFRQPEPYLEYIPLNKKTILWDKRFIITNSSKKPSLSVSHLGEKDYLEMIKLKKIVKADMHRYAVKTLPAVRSLDEVVSVPHLRYSKNKYWEKNIKIMYLYDKRLRLINNY